MKKIAVSLFISMLLVLPLFGAFALADEVGAPGTNFNPALSPQEMTILNTTILAGSTNVGTAGTDNTPSGGEPGIHP